ncbi:type IV pilin [Halosimplex sp. TS25]|uniref:type IV pilin n=1 Tax=Halosimplex rarum TaxID=3396619 RepID=UPI0039EB1969
MSDEGDDDGHNLVLIVAVVGIGLVVLGAVVVIGAAVVGSFVLGLGAEQGAVEPAASFGVDATADGATVTHEAGDSIDSSNLVILVDGEERGTWADLTESSDPVTTGDEIEISDVQSGDEIAVEWRDGDETAVLIRTQVGAA